MKKLTLATILRSQSSISPGNVSDIMLKCVYFIANTCLNPVLALAMFPTFDNLNIEDIEYKRSQSSISPGNVSDRKIVNTYSHAVIGSQSSISPGNVSD